MTLKHEIQAAISQVRDQHAFSQKLLGETLGRPLGEVRELEDFAYAWSADDLQITEVERKMVEGRASQVRTLAQGQQGACSGCCFLLCSSRAHHFPMPLIQGPA
ncbi:MAG: hypothetical protein ACRD3O_11680 [Terriglobia bacterium]